MDFDMQIGWTMALSSSVLGALALALISVPDLRPEEAALDCDRRGGIWSSETRLCQKTDSPLAGLSP